ncbi:MAG: thioredoxin [Anaerolineae bacterium]|nr:MAG: thioredoxin [Anaerolineae bacterium]
MSDVFAVTEETFDQEVLAASLPVLVDFSAVWCGPCKMLDPIIHQLAKEWEGKVKVVKVDADQNPDIVARYGVMGIPTLLLFKEGEIKERLVGYMPRDKLVEKLSPYL